MLSDAKTSDSRLTIAYLLQQMSEEYDRQEVEMKKELQIATHTGFIDQKFVYDRNNQLKVDTMEWLDPVDFGENVRVFFLPNSAQAKPSWSWDSLNLI